MCVRVCVCSCVCMCAGIKLCMGEGRCRFMHVLAGGGGWPHNYLGADETETEFSAILPRI